MNEKVKEAFVTVASQIVDYHKCDGHLDYMRDYINNLEAENAKQKETIKMQKELCSRYKEKTAKLVLANAVLNDDNDNYVAANEGLHDRNQSLVERLEKMKKYRRFTELICTKRFDILNVFKYKDFADFNMAYLGVDDKYRVTEEEYNFLEQTAKEMFVLCQMKNY